MVWPGLVRQCNYQIFNDHILSWCILYFSVTGNIRKALSSGIGVAAIALSSGLSGAVFFLQFLDWWYASEQNTAAVTSLPVPPPPPQVGYP